MTSQEKFSLYIGFLLIVVVLTGLITHKFVNSCWKREVINNGCGYYNPTNSEFVLGHFNKYAY